jgi:general secretion pathway protein L
MSVLVVVLPDRAETAPAGWRYVLGDEGRKVRESGRAAATSLPRADQRVLLVPARAVAWHRVLLPKAPPARLRAALAGVMEEQLLDDAEALHLALGADAAPGSQGWVAATARAPLEAALAALEADGRAVDRVVAELEPGAAWRGHVRADNDGDDAGAVDDLASLRLALSGPDGVAELALQGSLAKSLMATLGAEPVAREPVFSATPATAAAAERWLGQAVLVRSDAERALEVAETGVNLRQFELAPRHRGTRALREGLRRLATPAWRPVRWGLAALLVVNLIGLNAHAWQLRERISERKTDMGALLLATHPGSRIVIEPTLQMQRETERLRVAAGRPGPGDLEALLAAAAQAWPDGAGAASSLRFEPGRLVLGVPGWGDAQWQQFQQRARGSGLRAEWADAELRLMPPRPGAGP